MAFKKTMLALALGLSLASGANAEDLVAVYQQAVDYDSEIAASRATFNAQEERVYEARAGLLPQIAAGASASHNQRDSDSGLEDSYKAIGYSLSLTQPLFRADNWYRYQGSKFASKQAEAEFAQEQQNLILRTAEAYFSVLRAKENLTTAIAAEQAFERQWEQAKERFEVGLIAITEVQESKALYDAAQVQRITTEGDLAVALENLERLTGQRYTTLSQLSEQFPVVPPEPNDPDVWVQTAEQQNLAIQAALFALDVARQQVKTNQAGHYPTVDATASYSHADFDGPRPLDDQQDDISIGVEVTVPLYAGGGTQASVRRARYELERAEQVLATIRRNVTLDTRSLIRNINTNIQSIDARKQAIVSSQSALEATRAGYNVGTRNIVEVLEAEQAYYETLRDYANDRFNYVLNSLRLKQAAGTLSPDDLIQLNRWLVAEAQQS